MTVQPNRPPARLEPAAGAAPPPARASELLEIAIALRRVSDEVASPNAAAELRRLAFTYLDRAELAQVRENLGKPILGR
jgi:hypothetical protein